ncbi:nitrate ABC transporter ATP-binding protein [Mycobacterium alsense]|uniref:Nitrate ABC transporter ATP-binding protein n=1 Tax=Mycobacterium alsense TaxID=324058 RepID=A0ABD6P003_9MYCO|nr:ABC transporter ATP-binding protein [Mycobacterium alsense]OBG33892.1 nitrate ABC transporter ATP-binding protein [Mycobacterium alsense]
MGTQAVRITNGYKRFGATPVLAGIDLSVCTGEVMAVVGRSGSGKSTLLRVLAGLEKLTSGDIAWPADGARPQTGVVFQQPLLMPWLTAAENVVFAKRFAAHRKTFDARYATDLIGRFGLHHLADRYPEQLSGGQAQRVAILRAVATKPRLLLLDEPFSALDPATRAELQRWLADLAAELAVTVVLVTHDVDEALALAQRVVLLGEDGRIRREWLVDDVFDRADLRRDVLDNYRLAPAVSP